VSVCTYMPELEALLPRTGIKLAVIDNSFSTISCTCGNQIELLRVEGLRSRKHPNK
jgi:hypothetical protein